MTTEQERYESLCSTSIPTSSHPEGIVVAADLTQEWLLPWWWKRYKSFNNFPVTFVDLGLSLEMKQWCKERGHYIRLPVSGLFVTEKENLPSQFVSFIEKKQGSELWASRPAWFLKPLICLQSPYAASVWIDLDCEITGSLKELFSFCKHPSGISLAREESPHENLYFNSGVIAFQKGAPLIKNWALEALTGHLHHPGDQDLLTAMIKKHNISVGDLPLIYNWSRLKQENPEAIVVHWHGVYGKKIIAHQILKQNLAT